MKYIKFTLSIGYGRGASQEDVFAFPDEYTEEEIEREYQDWCNNYYDGGTQEISEEEFNEFNS